MEELDKMQVLRNLVVAATYSYQLLGEFCESEQCAKSDEVTSLEDQDDEEITKLFTDVVAFVDDALPVLLEPLMPSGRRKNAEDETTASAKRQKKDGEAKDPDVELEDAPVESPSTPTVHPEDTPVEPPKTPPVEQTSGNVAKTVKITSWSDEEDLSDMDEQALEKLQPERFDTPMQTTPAKGGGNKTAPKKAPKKPKKAAKEPTPGTHRSSRKKPESAEKVKEDDDDEEEAPGSPTGGQGRGGRDGRGGRARGNVEK